MEGTPFTMIKEKERYKIVIGRYQVSEELDTVDEIWEYLEKNIWLMIMRLVMIITKPDQVEIMRKVEARAEERAFREG